VTEGLLFEIGLNSKFFSSKDVTCMNKVMNIQTLCPDISYPEVTESFDTENGQIMRFDTTKVLD
jgi:hypothetical protein